MIMPTTPRKLKKQSGCGSILGQEQEADCLVGTAARCLLKCRDQLGIASLFLREMLPLVTRHNTLQSRESDMNELEVRLLLSLLCCMAKRRNADFNISSFVQACVAVCFHLHVEGSQQALIFGTRFDGQQHQEHATCTYSFLKIFPSHHTHLLFLLQSIMKASILALAALSLANAESTLSLRRRLSYEKIALYSPLSQVSLTSQRRRQRRCPRYIDILQQFLTISLFP